MELRFRNWKYLHTYLELKSSVSLGGGHASNGVVGIEIVCCRVSGQETALHWAAKHGDANVIKLIAGAYKVNPNIRSEDLRLISRKIRLSIQRLHSSTFSSPLQARHDCSFAGSHVRADDSIRDYSGKRADQYPDNYIRVVAGHKAAERRPLKQRPPEKEPTAPSSNSFMRIGSLNLRKARKSAVFASVRGGSRNRSSIGDMYVSMYEISFCENSHPTPVSSPLKFGERFQIVYSTPPIISNLVLRHSLLYGFFFN
ncbi:uncharacterized protein CEXT_669901, partial [Caerostris extrusa]